MDPREEQRNQRKSMYLSGGIHAALLLLFFFLLAWKEPFPPIPEYGIELNFGIDAQGSGTQQIESPVVQEETQETVEEVVEETESEEIIAENTPEEVEEVSPEQPSESVPEDTPAEPIESPDVVEDVAEPAPEVEAEPVEESTAEEANAQVEEPAATVAPGGVNQGDDTDEIGDKGEPEGVVDDRAIYGNPGAGGGASLNMAGWMWDYTPKPKDDSQENGRIVFSITIDDEGEIISIRTVEKTVTPAVERIYRAEVEKLTFSTTSDNTIPAPTSSGTITFIIKSN